MTRGIIDQAARNRPSIMPEDLSRLRVECKHIVRPGEVHDAVHHDGCAFEHPGSPGMKNPLRLQVAHILRSYLGKTAEATSCIVTVVRRPIVFNLRRSIGTGTENHHPQASKLHILSALPR